uniref:Uncharacterized protein n=1 Tax=Ixodes ricinus TaxID=34613 RepID=A0A6B0UBM1_IXORI
MRRQSRAARSLARPRLWLGLAGPPAQLGLRIGGGIRGGLRRSQLGQAAHGSRLADRTFPRVQDALIREQVAARASVQVLEASGTLGQQRARLVHLYDLDPVSEGL